VEKVDGPRNGRRNDSFSYEMMDQAAFDSSCYVQLKLPDDVPPDVGRNYQFAANDLVLLLKLAHRDILRQLTQSNVAALNAMDSFRKCGLIGHLEVSRKGVQNLLLKVSKKQWVAIGEKRMVLVTIGSNVTALREFTALCLVDRLPLVTYVLGQHLKSEANRRKLSRNQSIDQIVHTMGGAAALGEGFTSYARNKFNASQLCAIAASAQQYGDGGFSLIKGPPGTGSK
jgi:hypothetical protein